MSRRKKIGIVIGVLVVATVTLVAFSLGRQRRAGVMVRLERVARGDRVRAVTASGTIAAKTCVDFRADTTGRIVAIGVRGGDVVRHGQFLLQIDPAQYQAAVARAEGVVASTRATVLQTQANRDQAERGWKRAKQLSE